MQCENVWTGTTGAYKGSWPSSLLPALVTSIIYSFFSLPGLNMVSKFALLIDLLVTSVALAVPSSRLEPQLARLRKIRRFGPTNRAESPVNSISDVVNNTNWAGAVLGGGNVRVIPRIRDHS